MRKEADIALIGLAVARHRIQAIISARRLTVRAHVARVASLTVSLLFAILFERSLAWAIY